MEGPNFILRIKEQETRLIFHEHDDNHDDDDDEQWQEVKSINIVSGLWEGGRWICVRLAAEAQFFSAQYLTQIWGVPGFLSS
jgi:hypothetical protein